MQKDSDPTEEQDNVLDWSSAKSRLDPKRKEKAAKDLQKRFQKAMGWNNWPKKKKKGGSKGPTKPRGGKGKKR